MGKLPEPIDTARVFELAQRSIPPTRWWPVPAVAVATGEPERSHPSSPDWTEQHVQVAAWLTSDPQISTREIARRLYPGTDGGGDYSTKAKAVRVLVERVVGDALLGVRTRNNTSERPQANDLTA